MTSKTKKERRLAEFAARINLSLDRVGYPTKFHGRQTALAKKLDVDPKAARKWLSGQGFPSDEKLEELARLTKETLSYLRYGEGVSAHEGHFIDIVTESSSSDTVSNIKRGPVTLGVVPLLTLKDIRPNVRIVSSEKTVPSPPVDNLPNIMATLVEGTAMQREQPPSYPNGCYIYWKPSDTASVGDHIIATTSDGTNVFRELDSDGAKQVLKPLNPQYPIISDEFTILAVVTGKYEPIKRP